MGCEDPHVDCDRFPYCDQCVCPGPGGGGLFKPAPLYTPRAPMLGDHGVFAVWESSWIVAAHIIKIHADGKVDLWLDYANGGRYRKERMDVAASEAEWNHYLQDRDQHYLPLLTAARKAAYEEWNAQGYQNLKPVFYEGKLYVPDYLGVDCTAIVTDVKDCGLEVLAILKGGRGQLVFSKVQKLDGPTNLSLWEHARVRWIPILLLHVAKANEAIAKYQNGGYGS